jgi:hypothetical protein
MASSWPKRDASTTTRRGPPGKRLHTASRLSEPLVASAFWRGPQGGLLWPPLPTSHHHHHHHHHENDDDDDDHHHQLTQTMALGLGLVMLPQLRRHRLARVAFTEVCPWANLVQPHRYGATRIFIFRWSNFNPRPNSSFSREGSSTSRFDCSRGAL